MFFDVFTGQTAADASAFDGRCVEVVFSQQTTDRRAQRVVVLLFQRRLLALRRSGRFLFRFGAGFFTRAVAFTQATKDLTRRYRCTFIFQNRIQNAVC